MRPIREMLRYSYELGLSNEKISLSLKISKGSVHNTLSRFKSSGLSWPLPAELSDDGLENRLYGPRKEISLPEGLPLIDYIEKELSRPHVTLQLLYEEYARENPKGLSRASFYRHYTRHNKKQVSLKMIHKGGDKLYIDYSGDSICYIERSTGEEIMTELFVCSWGASSFSYAEVTETQKKEDFTLSHVRAFQYFDGLPNALVPDNLKSAVSKANRYDPVINRLYGEMTAHYGIAVLPARPAKPKDKAVVESNVLHLQRFILGGLRNRTFFSLTEINEAIAELIEEYNDRPMKDYGNQSRRDRFRQLDMPFIRKLPDSPFEITRIASELSVAPNYHVRFENHHYSVPHVFARTKVDIYQKGRIIEIYQKGVHICRHKQGPPNYGYTTIDAHMPDNHRFVKGWSSGWFIFQAEKISPEVSSAVKIILESKRHPEQAFNAVMGVIRLAKVYGEKRLSAACRRASFFRSVSYRSIKSILEKKLDQQSWGEKKIKSQTSQIAHENIRGQQYYNRKEEENPCI